MGSYYTGAGDLGTTTLFGMSDRLPKTSAVFEALGAVDELNCWLGFCRVNAVLDELPEIAVFHGMILRIQEHLFIAQAQLGGADQVLSPEALAEIEGMIEIMARPLSPVTGFTIPGESVMSAVLDVARTQARRAERRVLAAGSASEAAAYLNRLSSLLFVMARRANDIMARPKTSPSYL